MASRTETGWPFGPARQHEDVGGGEQARDVVTLAGEAHGVREPARADLLLQARPVGPVADDHRLERPHGEAAEGLDEGREVLGRLQPADRDQQRRLPGGDRLGRRADVHCVRDHDRRVVVAGACRQSRLALALRDADRRSGQRPHQPVCRAVGAGGKTRVGRERPAVRSEDPDRHACERRREPAQDAGLRTVRVQDVRPLASQQADQLDKARKVAKRAHRAPHIRQRDEACAGRLGRVPQRAFAVSRHRDVEPADQRRQQRRHVRLRAADLRERDEQQHARPGG